MIQHHEGQSPVSFKRVVQGKFDDGFLLPEFQPEVTGNWGIMFVDFTVTINPGVKLAL
jgi:hypothetical protein